MFPIEQSQRVRTNSIMRCCFKKRLLYNISNQYFQWEFIVVQVLQSDLS